MENNTLYSVSDVISELENRGISFASEASVRVRLRELRRGTKAVWHLSDGTRREKMYPPELVENVDYVYVERSNFYTAQGLEKIASLLIGSRYHKFRLGEKHGNGKAEKAEAVA